MAILKKRSELEILIEAGRKLAEILSRLKTEVVPGINALSLEKLSLELIRLAKAEPVFLGYQPSGADKPYPASICISVNDKVVHAPPTDYFFKEGDIVTIDAGLRYRGWCVDSALTVGVGKISREAQKLIKVTEEALYEGIAMALPGKRLGDIGATIQRKVEGAGFSIVRELTGHGIGREVHEEPFVFNFGSPGKGELIEEGLVIAIEPITALGKGSIKQLKDESYATVDGSLAAHFEHTIVVTKEGPMVLTAR